MIIDNNVKKALLIFGGGLLIFYVFKKIKPFGKKKSTSKSKGKTKIVSEEDKKQAAIVMSAYDSAKKAGESKSFLDEMNLEFSKEYKMKVYTEKGSGGLFVSDLEGNKIL